MSEVATVEIADVQKSLKDAIDALSKGHSSQGTNTLSVETMAGEGGPTQIHHTPSDSDPGSWAGSVARDVPENGATDDISGNNAEYGNKGQMVKSIKEKLAKGLPLTKAEYDFVVKGGMPFDKDEDDKAKKAVDCADDMEKGDLSIEHDDDDMGKSVTEAVSSDASLSQGFEVTDFLSDWSASITKSVDASQQALFKSITKYIDARFEQLRSEQDGVTKSLSKAIGSVGDAALYTAQRLEGLEAQPAHAPKSFAGIQAVQKGGFAGAPASAGDDVISKAMNGDRVARSQVNEALAQLVFQKKIPAQAAILFDSTGQISPEHLAQVSAAI